MSSLSDFVVENYPGAVSPVTHQYEGDVQKKHISLADDRHKSHGGLQNRSASVNVMETTTPIDPADRLA
ncbi:hypothetical protein GCM10007175_12870 [Pseudarthrobacter scleromae]|uniref:Uncharacterized protein n=1 Tax=Pseudarthrobacter scleromae TaxID=158897 RepID=A0ABQ2CD37_9MICC|nr:hypothetical protein GCM10007175_12870 [Pseudarthrobacter scleromae]